MVIFADGVSGLNDNTNKQFVVEGRSLSKFVSKSEECVHVIGNGFGSGGRVTDFVFCRASSEKVTHNISVESQSQKSKKRHEFLPTFRK